ncbi:MAG: hypothetical protein CO030_00980 [Candidatus Magasanikbacteria bacterium CG_4_9_14_0_2_um_filter_42_11]|uniref:Uncharacterized protein n=1 Tax=Candidatus Magasanikbacteria bacterium CG_4_9_14_0_2_um_filter_42_11 TaxID=1974643 RepID=A0A2M8FAN7_9BACT|nr:MAG: hypothetical protein COU34_00385 [Candidatus Magasanikbacteria bacterium CG10_big_fil_rev_8_21_14_0_10_43_9]PIY92040.1 MAG: hypothetical protein COY70_05340 [Candidatus Magasanikbacteria bacterium CG_4_10_14_0_8_um_filter_42_12]PJC52800.1 MAG: hypothetical protein CO030_00980 [Candidatus Magasanikbacteria bacterium CG_4_9_14_0_2_um_filter_42_11]
MSNELKKTHQDAIAGILIVIGCLVTVGWLLDWAISGELSVMKDPQIVATQLFDKISIRLPFDLPNFLGGILMVIFGLIIYGIPKDNKDPEATYVGVSVGMIFGFLTWLFSLFAFVPEQGLALGLLVGFIVGLTSGFISGFLNEPKFGVLNGVTIGVGTGLGIAMAYGFAWVLLHVTP